MWNTFVLDPMTNLLLLLYSGLWHNPVLAILAFTVLIRGLSFPLNWRQQKSMKAMQAFTQSKEWQAIQKKYAKDREKLAQEQMRLYREHGINPLGGCLPMLVQFPVFIGMFGAISRLLPDTPLKLLELANHIYPFFPNVNSLIPLQNRFLWLNLGQPDPYYILPALVVLTTYLSQKFATPPAADPQSAQMSRSMMLTMPLMIGIWTVSAAAGVGFYWLVLSLFGMLQYWVTDRLLQRQPAKKPTLASSGKRQVQAPAKK